MRDLFISLCFQADTVAEFGGWTRTLTSEIRRLSQRTASQQDLNGSEDKEREIEAEKEKPAPLTEQDETEQLSLVDLRSLQPTSEYSQLVFRKFSGNCSRHRKSKSLPLLGNSLTRRKLEGLSFFGASHSRC